VKGAPDPVRPRWRLRAPRALGVGVAVLVLAVPATRVLRAADVNANGIVVAQPLKGRVAVEMNRHSTPELPLARHAQALPDPDTLAPSIAETAAPPPAATVAEPAVLSAADEIIVARHARAALGSRAPAGGAPHVATRSGFGIAEFGGRE
jgi:hypothetical protein